MNEFVSSDQDFSGRVNSTYLKLLFIIPIGGLSIVALGYSIMNNDGDHSIKKLSKIRHGLSFMDQPSIIITLSVFILFFIGLFIFLKAYYKSREIVVGLKFNDERKKLTVTTKTIGSIENTRTFEYHKISLESNNLSDGMTSPMYQTLTLVYEEYLAGHIYENHFTWPESEFLEIKKRLYNSVGFRAKHSG